MDEKTLQLIYANLGIHPEYDKEKVKFIKRVLAGEFGKLDLTPAAVYPEVGARLEAISRHPHFGRLTMDYRDGYYHVTIWCSHHHGPQSASARSLLTALGQIMTWIDVDQGLNTWRGISCG